MDKATETTTAFDNIDAWVSLSNDGLIGEIFGLFTGLADLLGHVSSLLGLI